MKHIILPGEKIADGKLRVSHTFTDGDATYAAVLGFLDEDRFMPLEGPYQSRQDDVIVGIVIGVRSAGYEIDINTPYGAFVQSRDLRIRLQAGDIVMAQIYGGGKEEAKLTQVRRLPAGKIVHFQPMKIPRLIGKKSSMINLIKEGTGGEIIVGNNGYIWISENCNVPKALEALETIQQKAHQSGLTDEIAALLK